MSDGYILLSIFIMAALTALTRFAPFLLFPPGRPTPLYVLYLGRVLPKAVIGMLVIYCFKHVHFTSLPGFLPDLIAAGLTAGSYVKKRNTLLSIVLGVVSYMILLRVLV